MQIKMGLMSIVIRHQSLKSNLALPRLVVKVFLILQSLLLLAKSETGEDSADYTGGQGDCATVGID